MQEASDENLPVLWNGYRNKMGPLLARLTLEVMSSPKGQRQANQMQALADSLSDDTQNVPEPAALRGLVQAHQARFERFVAP